MPGPQPSTVTVLSATATLTNDEILHLPTTRILVVDAPGSGKMLVPIYGQVVLHDNAGAYTFPLGAVWQLLYGATGNAEITGLIDLPPTSEGAGETCAFPPFAAVGSGLTDGYLVTSLKPIEARENQGLYIGDNLNGVSDYTGGNAANSMDVTVLYAIIDV